VLPIVKSGLHDVVACHEIRMSDDERLSMILLVKMVETPTLVPSGW